MDLISKLKKLREVSVLELLQPQILCLALRLGEGRWWEILAITAPLPCGNLLYEQFLQDFLSHPSSGVMGSAAP